LTANTRAIGRAFKVMPQDGAGIRYCGEPISTYAYVNPAVAVLLGWLLANGRLDARARAGRPHHSIRGGAGFGEGWGSEASG